MLGFIEKNLQMSVWREDDGGGCQALERQNAEFNTKNIHQQRRQKKDGSAVPIMAKIETV